jgi:hypothetical protein
MDIVHKKSSAHYNALSSETFQLRLKRDPSITTWVQAADPVIVLLVSTAVLFWVHAPCSPVRGYLRFVGTYSLHLQGYNPLDHNWLFHCRENVKSRSGCHWEVQSERRCPRAGSRRRLFVSFIFFLWKSISCCVQNSAFGFLYFP